MASSEIQKERVINELRGFIKKLLQDPQTLELALAIARRIYNENEQTGRSEQEVMARIANEISATTSVHIPEDPSEHSEADKLFLEVLKEVAGEERGLY